MANHPISPERLNRYLESARRIEEKHGGITVRLCMDSWGYASSAAAMHCMNVMVKAGLLKRFERGSKSFYRCVSEQ